MVDGLSDVDFDLACRAGRWFATHDSTGLTPRQVPVEGLHAKWLNNRHALVRDLADVDDLKLAPPHPAPLHFTYLGLAGAGAGLQCAGRRRGPVRRPRRLPCGAEQPGRPADRSPSRRCAGRAG